MPDGEKRAATQSFDLADMRIALALKALAESVALLNQILAETMTLQDLHKKHRWLPAATRDIARWRPEKG